MPIVPFLKDSAFEPDHIHASPDETLECVLVRSDNEAVVVNLDIDAAEKAETVAWVDPIIRARARPR